MTYRQKLVWASLLALLIYGGYFAATASDIVGGRGAVLSFWRLVICVGGLIGLEVGMTVALSVVTAVTAPQDLTAWADERERMFALRGVQAGFYVLSAGAVLAAGAGVVGFGVGVVGNGLILALVAADVVRYGVEIVHYRIGG